MNANVLSSYAHKTLCFEWDQISGQHLTNSLVALMEAALLGPGVDIFMPMQEQYLFYQ